MSNLERLYKDELKDKNYFITEIKVRWEEMDVNGHINYANYLSYYSEARIEAIGQELFKHLRTIGIGPVIYKAELNFHKELFHPDVAHIVTWVAESVSKTRIAVAQRIYSTQHEELSSSAMFYAIFMDIQKRKPVRMPDELREMFKLK